MSPRRSLTKTLGKADLLTAVWMAAMPCGKCGAPVWTPAHRCPRLQACVDCSGPADVFVPDPDRFPLLLSADGEVEWSGQYDKPICDVCLQKRLAREHAGGQLTGAEGRSTSG